jgi:hypothetical protein
MDEALKRIETAYQRYERALAREKAIKDEARDAREEKQSAYDALSQAIEKANQPDLFEKDKPDGS